MAPANPAKLGTAVKLKGYACVNPNCVDYRLVKLYPPPICEHCGLLMHPATVSVANFQWVDGDRELA